MSKTSNTVNKVSNEQVKMRKYIVEAPEPKAGQKVSTGGIREKGKMAVPFKNPVPYEEPKTATTKMIPANAKSNVPQKADNTIYWDLGKYFLGFVWRNFGEPVVGAWLQEKGQEIVQSITEQPKQSQEPEIIDVPEEDVRVVSIDDDKVVQFRSNRAMTGVK